MLFGGGILSSTRVFLCVCSLHVCVISVVLLGQLCGSCDWGVPMTAAFYMGLPWGIFYLREVLPVAPPPPTCRGTGVGKPALFPQLVPPPSAVFEEEVGLVLCGYCCFAWGVCGEVCPLLCII